MTRMYGGDHSLVCRTQLRVSHSCILEHDLYIHTMVLDIDMRIPDIRNSRDDNFCLAFSSSPQFELKMHKVTDHKATIEDVTNEEDFKDANSNTRGHSGHHRHGGGGDGRGERGHSYGPDPRSYLGDRGVHSCYIGQS